jgi:hypothetical protein
LPIANCQLPIAGLFLALIALEVVDWARVLFVVCARAAIFLASSVTWVMTPELYPTSIRGAGHSWANGIARFGAIATPYWGDADLPLGQRLAFYSAATAAAGIAALLLTETKGRILG